MKPVDQFLQSVREGFTKNQATDWTRVGLLVVFAIALSIALSLWLGRWKKRRALQRRIDVLVAAAGLRTADLDYLSQIASAAGHTVLEVMTALPPFEGATAAALASEAPTPRPPEGSAFDRVRRLRKALGFSPLPPHHWLLSTRELVAGDRVALVGVAGLVSEANEASFAVDLAAPAPRTSAPSPAVGTFVNLAIVRADDSRYLARVRVLATEQIPGTMEGSGGTSASRRVFFGHDEKPERQQHREHVRVRVRGPVSVQIIDPVRKQHGAGTGTGLANPAAAPEPPLTDVTLEGTLGDVSAGGLSLNLPLSSSDPIPRGARLRCSFTLDGAGFEMLAAVVSDAGAGPGAGIQHIRVSFTSLGDAERDRLASAVNRILSRPASDGAATGA